MKKLILLSLLACSCAPNPVIVDRSELAGIPAEASIVVADTQIAADSLFTVISKSLGQRGWLVSSSKEALQINCEGRELKGNVYVKPFIQIESTGPHSSKALFRGVWSLTKIYQENINFLMGPYTDNKKRITWKGWNTSPGVSFQHLVSMAKKVPDSKISYRLK